MLSIFFVSFFLRSKTKKRYSNLSRSPRRSLLPLRSFCGAKHPEEKRRGRRRRRDERTRVVQLEEEEALEGKKYLLSRRRHHIAHVFWKKSHEELVKAKAVSIETSASPSSIPPYNDELVRSILEEVKAHHREMLSLLRKLENAEENNEKKNEAYQLRRNPPFFDFAKQESVDNLSQRTREKESKVYDGR